MTTILYLVGMTVAAECAALRIVGRGNSDWWALIFWTAVFAAFVGAEALIWGGRQPVAETETEIKPKRLNPPVPE